MTREQFKVAEVPLGTSVDKSGTRMTLPQIKKNQLEEFIVNRDEINENISQSNNESEKKVSTEEEMSWKECDDVFDSLPEQEENAEPMKEPAVELGTINNDKEAKSLLKETEHVAEPVSENMRLENKSADLEPANALENQRYPFRRVPERRAREAERRMKMQMMSKS